MTAEFAAWLAEPLTADVERSIGRLRGAGDVVRVAAMPDVHLAEEVCVGVVVATTRRIYPAAVGGDIGCGMAALRFDCGADALDGEDAAARVLTSLQREVPVLVHPRSAMDHPLPEGLDDGPLVLRVTDGAHTACFTHTSRAALVAEAFVVEPTSDRRGVRLRGPALVPPPVDIASVGVCVGAVQVTPSGQLVVLGVDRATTGGYPVLAHVIRADAWLLGQLRPGAQVRFAHVGFDEARRLWLQGDRCG